MSELAVDAWYPAPPERVWRAITTPDEIRRWFSMETDFAPRVGHRFTFRSAAAPPLPGWGGVVHCEVLEVEPPRRLVYSWRDSWRWAPMRTPTVVTWTLTPERGGTRLQLTHTGFEGLGGRVLGRMLRFGWGSALRKHLAALVGENL